MRHCKVTGFQNIIFTSGQFLAARSLCVQFFLETIPPIETASMKLSPAESWITLCRKGTFLQWRTSGRVCYAFTNIEEVVYALHSHEFSQVREPALSPVMMCPKTCVALPLCSSLSPWHMPSWHSVGKLAYLPGVHHVGNTDRGMEHSTVSMVSQIQMSI